MAASPMAETTGVAVRCRTLGAVNAPGTLAWERQRWTRRPAAGRPGMARGGRRSRRRGYAQFHRPLVSTDNQAAELRLCSNPPQPYAHIVILAAQKSRKPAQVSTN